MCRSGRRKIKMKKTQNKFCNLKINSYICIRKLNITIMAKYADNWGGLNKADNEFHDKMWDKYVPSCGKADTLGGEILRAINRIVYKYYNDGDTVACYYSSSYNHSYGAELFLMDKVPGYKPMRNIDEFKFEDAVCKNLKTVVDYLRENPSLFEKKNEEDFLDLSPEEEWEDEDDFDEDIDW